MGVTAGVERAVALGAVGLETSQKVILTAARLIRVKGLDLAIRAFRESGLAQQGWVYAIAGRGALEGELKALAGEELGRSIRFLGFVPPGKLLTAVRHAQFFLFPSRYEPHGIVVQEAMSAGVPVLASDVVGAAHDLVRPGETGLLATAGVPEALTAAIRELLSNQPLRHHCSTACRRVVEAEYALAVQARAYHALYTELSARTKTKP